VAQADTDTNFSQGKTSAKQEELSAWLRPAKESPRALAHVNKARPAPATRDTLERLSSHPSYPLSIRSADVLNSIRMAMHCPAPRSYLWVLMASKRLIGR
jgi:hypothetical protein